MRLTKAVVSAALTVASLFATCAQTRADNELASLVSTFYIVAPGGDASVAPIVHELTKRMQAMFDQTGGAGTVWVMPRLSWAPSDLESQCENDPNAKDTKSDARVIGGLILEGTNTYSATDPFVLWEHGWAKVTTSAELVSCKPVGFEKPTITWVSNNLEGYGSRVGFPFETIASGALAAVVQSPETKGLLVGVAVGGYSSSTIPPVSDALTTHDAATRIANDILQKFNAGCAAKIVAIQPMCAKLGLPVAKLPDKG